MRARATLLLVLLVAASAAPLAAASYSCTDQDGYGVCYGDWVSGPGCNKAVPGHTYGARATEVTLEAGRAGVDVTGIDRCSVSDGRTYDSPAILVTETSPVAFSVEWVDMHAAGGYERCAIFVSHVAEGNDALPCPDGVPPPDPGWGELLP